MKFFIFFMAVAVVLVTAVPCLAGQTIDSESITVRVRIDTISPFLNVAITEVKGDIWATRNSIDFGNLAFDSNYDIWRAESYYAVDVGVVGNATDWVVTHTVSSITGPGGDLDNNVNVAFVRHITPNISTNLAYLSYPESNDQSYTREELAADSGGWLRIYYGIAGGEGDAPGVEPIGADATPGTYVGAVTLTLTEN